MNPNSGERRPIPLAQLMRQAASELEAQAVPPMPEALLQAAPTRPALAGPSSGLWARSLQRLAGRPAAIAAGGALVLLGATWLVLGPLWNGADRGRPSMQVAAESNPFVPVVSAERWVRLAGEGASPAWLMTADLPAERLAAYGLPYDPGRAAEPVRAEFLLNPAGDVLAVRVVNPAR